MYGSMSKVRGETDDQLHSEEVKCQYSSALSILCKLLYQFSSWQVGNLSEWSQLAEFARKEKIVTYKDSLQFPMTGWRDVTDWPPLDSLASQETSLDDEFVEENYGAPINTVSM